ncbi:MAG TPA: serine hydrolase domain-containing protein [Vicinamibacterales bacterium]|nr:serine hydrolase domain-containing protein [Vicinamibacterales bacterium]
MKHRLLCLTVILSALAIAPTRAADSLVYSVFGDYLEGLRVQTGIPGMAATIVTGTTTAWERSFGLQDVDRNKAVLADTPFEIDGLTQFIVASLALRCDESGWISIDDPVGKYVPASADAGATLRMLMTHTSQGASGLTFAYRLDRLAPMADAIAKCTDSSFRSGIGALLDRMGMYDSVPGSDAAVGVEFDTATQQRYSGVVARLATPYAVDGRGKATASSYRATALTPSAGAVSTVRDLAKFDVALKSGLVVRPQTLLTAWTAPLNLSGPALPHGIGWFVQTYQGEPVVWQFGVADNASSSMVVTLPRRGLTFIVLANSSGLAQSFNLAAGDLTSSPFARLFLGTFVR